MRDLRFSQWCQRTALFYTKDSSSEALVPEETLPVAISSAGWPNPAQAVSVATEGHLHSNSFFITASKVVFYALFTPTPTVHVNK